MREYTEAASIDIDDEDWVDLGPCCCCEGTYLVRNIVMLDKKTPISGTGWGCFVCDLPLDGAFYVACDACMKIEIPAKFAVKGKLPEHGRIPIDQLTGEHKHDMSKHTEVVLS